MFVETCSKTSPRNMRNLATTVMMTTGAGSGRRMTSPTAIQSVLSRLPYSLIQVRKIWPARISSHSLQVSSLKPPIARPGAKEDSTLSCIPTNPLAVPSALI